jgi:molybdenum cofactor cytidylyltransferase
MKVACLILAAGESKRFGYPKQILPWRDSTILGTVIDEALKASFYKVFVVLGAHFEKITLKLSDILQKVEVVNNENWHQGMFSSIKKGLNKIAKENIDYVLIQLGDMPFVTSDIFNKFITLAGNKEFIIATEDNRPAHPYMFFKKYIPLILNSDFKNGMRDLINVEFQKALKIPTNRDIGRQDIDTWEIYKNLKNFKNCIDK